MHWTQNQLTKGTVFSTEELAWAVLAASYYDHNRSLNFTWDGIIKIVAELLTRRNNATGLFYVGSIMESEPDIELTMMVYWVLMRLARRVEEEATGQVNELPLVSLPV